MLEKSSSRHVKRLFIISAILWILGSVIAELGYLTNIIINNSHATNICKITSSTILYSSDLGYYILIVLQANLTFISYPNLISVYSNNINVYSDKNQSIADQYRNRFYLPGYSYICYTHCSNNADPASCSIYTGPFQEYISLIVSAGLLLLSLMLLFAGCLILCFYRLKRRAYDDLESANHELEGSKSNFGESNFELILNDFGQAQAIMWKYQYRIEESQFNMLRKAQSDAIYASPDMKTRFQKEVYKVIMQLNLTKVY